MKPRPTIEEALRIVQEALTQAKAIEKALGLNGHAPTVTSGTAIIPTWTTANPFKAKRTYKRSNAGRARQIAAMKAYWAKRRAGKAKAKK